MPQRMPRARLAATSLAFLLALGSAQLAVPPVQAQAVDPGRPRTPPRPIVDAFSRDAVTYDELVEQATVQPYAPGELVVALELDVPKREAANHLRSLDLGRFLAPGGARLIAPLMAVERGASRSVALVHVALPPGLDVFAAMRALRDRPDVLWSSPDFIGTGDAREWVPDDPSYTAQYHHSLMQNHLAWDVTPGSASVRIAITDDGMELTHSDLAPNLWVNPGEVAGNGLDDDGNGYADDVNGWDFSSHNNDPNPNAAGDAHGTHVAGIAGARTNNAVGVAGVAGQCTLMPIQFYGPNGWTSTMINGAFRYAVDNDAQILVTSYNLDGWVGNAVVAAALQYVHDGGVLHFCSAGNDNAQFPARRVLTQPLFVANTTSTGMKASTSNYGTWVDVSAPGNMILSTVLSNGYGNKSGTSMATPSAAGAAALLWSANPAWNSYQVACALFAGARNLDAQDPSYAGWLGWGRVNSRSALVNPIAAPKVRYIAGLPAEGGEVDASALTGFDVAFSQVMDHASVNDVANWELRGAGPNDAFGDGDDVVQVLSIPTPYRLGTNELRIDIASAPLPCGNYRLTLDSGGLRNPFATALDGNSDGSPGDDHARTFRVTRLAYVDSDFDGYGAGSLQSVCPVPAGYSLVAGDCDDLRPDAHPGALEFCSGADDDCDGIVDFPPVFASSNVPITISSSGTPTVTSTLTWSGLSGQITEFAVKDLLLRHTNVGDLRVTLTSPGGATFVLFDRPGVPATASGCGENHILATFEDGAALTATQFETTCNPSTPSAPPPYAIAGTYQPVTPLAALLGTNPNGTWTLTVQDLRAVGGGAIEGWGLYVVTTDTYQTWYFDVDRDGYGDPAKGITVNCAPGVGYVLAGTDCFDEAPGIHPGAPELCDGVDNNCDGVTDGAEVCGVGVDDARLPEAFALDQNQPNPFRGRTTIHLALPTNARVTLEVFDVSGRRVAEVVNRHMDAGRHSVEFDASRLRGGLYFYRMRAAGEDGRAFAQIRRFMLVR